MIDQTVISSSQPSISFGMRLKSVREGLGIDRKDAAAQLRLPENVITMIESGEFSQDLPLMFVRGYLRNYSKLLEIPEQEVLSALELMLPKPEAQESMTAPQLTPFILTEESDSRSPLFNIFKQVFTFLLALTLIILMGMWLHSHKKAATEDTVQTITSLKTVNPAAENKPVPVTPKNNSFNLSHKALDAQKYIQGNYAQSVSLLILFLAALVFGLWKKTVSSKNSKMHTQNLRMPIYQTSSFTQFAKRHKIGMAVTAIMGIAVITLNFPRHKSSSEAVAEKIASVTNTKNINTVTPLEVELAGFPHTNLSETLVTLAQLNALQAGILEEINKPVLTNDVAPVVKYKHKRRMRRQHRPAYIYKN